MGHSTGFLWTKEKLERAAALRETGKLHHEVAASLTAEWGQPIRESQVRSALRGMKSRRAGSESPQRAPHVAASSAPPAPFQAEVQIVAPPSGDLPIEDLIADRIRRFERKKANEEARKLIPVMLRTNDPIGILHFGDPHLDDDGTDLRQVKEHGEIIGRTPGMYGANVGDTTNNWIGRLAALYGAQTTKESEAWLLAEWFIRDLVKKWLYIVAGNHDLWSGAGDPMQWISGQAGALYQDSEVRIALRFPNGREVRVNCRHDFAGNSQYNPAHGPMKAALFGTRDHLLLAGHKHESAYGVLKDPDSGITMHAAKVASYKLYDRYARDKGLRDQSLSPCVVTVIDPNLEPTDPDLIKLFWSPQRGADYLTYLRSGR